MLNKTFYSKPTLKLAKSLLGKNLVRKTGKKTYIGRIVETEAYLKNDPASHAFKVKSLRNNAMFLEAGSSYVYLIYGMYNCFNVVSNVKGVAEAVLIRAVEPVEGISFMKKNRGQEMIFNLCNGPGKLCQAMEIDRSLNEKSLISDEFYITEGKKENFKTIITTRIGISEGKDLQYRFYIKGNKFISKK